MKRAPSSVLRSALFSAGSLTALALWGTVSLLLFPFPYRARFAFITAWADFVVWWLRITCSIDHRVTGLENIPDESVVVFAKHQSTWETLFLISLFRPQTWVLKRELLWLPVFGWAVALLRPIAIDRATARMALKQVLRQGKERLREGTNVVVFPEGTRMAAGETRRYGISGTLLAQATGTTITPVAHNAGYFWPRRGLRKKPGTIRFVIGPPIDPAGRDARDVNKEIQTWIEAKVAEISEA